MWARICEMLLAVWLVVSHWLFFTTDGHDLTAALFIFFCASLSFIEALNKAHLLQVLPAGFLLYIGYTYPSLPLPFSYQNYILIALTLLMLAVVPSNASGHPRPWRRFLKKGI